MHGNCHFPQHRLYFFPLPHGQGSLRPTFFCFSGRGAGGLLSASCFRRSERIASVGIFVVRMCLRKSSIQRCDGEIVEKAVHQGHKGNRCLRILIKITGQQVGCVRKVGLSFRNTLLCVFHAATNEFGVLLYRVIYFRRCKYMIPSDLKQLLLTENATQ